MIELFDTHQHLLYCDQLNYDWTDDLVPLAKRDFTISDYQSLTQDKGMMGSIFMEVAASDYRAETRFISTLAADPANNIMGLVSSCRPETFDGFEAWIEECETLPVVGYRRILHEVRDEMSRTDTFRNNVRKIGQKGRVFDMVFRADQLGIAYDFAKSCDDMVLVLDHCGVPDIASGEISEWKTAIRKIAELPHVTGKLSGVLAYCADGAAYSDAIKPYIDHMIESFGPSGLIWGSDWPVVNMKSDLPNWIDIFRDLIADLSIDEQVAISNGNAKKVYKVTAR